MEIVGFMPEVIMQQEARVLSSALGSGPRAGSPDPEARNRFVFALGERIAEMSAHLDAAAWRLLEAIREFDRLEGWGVGFTGCAHWLTWRCQMDEVTARDKVRVARALANLPKISEALRLGRVSYSKVRAMTRVANPANEGELLHLALNGTASHVERVVRGYRRAKEGESLEDAARRQEERYVRIYTDEGGMVVIRARLTPEVGALVKKALDGALDQIREERRRSDDCAETSAEGCGDALHDSAESRAAEVGCVDGHCGEAGFQGRGPVAPDRCESGVRDRVRVPGDSAESSADGSGDCMHDSAESADLGRPRAGEAVEATPPPLHAVQPVALPDPADPSARTDGRCNRELLNLLQDARREPLDQLRADALGLVAEAALGKGLGCRERGEPYQVVVHVDTGMLAGTAEEGACELEDGPGLCPETVRRIACDAPVLPVTRGPDGAVLEVGRRSRRISVPLWRVLAARDTHCRFPGCRRRSRLQAHHVRHWAQGGETGQGNLVLLCRSHHWAVHEGGYRVRVEASGQVVFLRPDGSAVPRVPPTAAVPAGPMRALMDENRARGLEIALETNLVGWGGEPLDLVWAVEGLLQAEASCGERPR